MIAAFTAAVHALFPALVIVRGLSPGASGSRYFRRAGVPGYAIHTAVTASDDTFAHRLDEKLPPGK